MGLEALEVIDGAAAASASLWIVGVAVSVGVAVIVAVSVGVESRMLGCGGRRRCRLRCGDRWSGRRRCRLRWLVTAGVGVRVAVGCAWKRFVLPLRAPPVDGAEHCASVVTIELPGVSARVPKSLQGFPTEVGISAVAWARKVAIGTLGGGRQGSFRPRSP